EKVSFWSFCTMVGCLTLPLGLIMIEPDNGSVAVVGATLIALFFISRISSKYWVIPMCIMIACGAVAAYKLPYVRARIDVYLHPELDIRGKGHQAHQAKIAAGSGKIFGRGVGSSLQKLTYLPEAQNDYIAAIYAEEFGFVGMLLLITLYMLFACGGFSISLRAKTLQGSFLSLMITYLITLQAFLNLGVVSGLLPAKGVNLPFFSQGGTSLVANILGLALLLSIGKDVEEKAKKNHFDGRRDRGASLPRASSR
ncbi:MAG: FtsW/RodA/SpoVE family cell cycle protein, partial [Chlamydiales bacterium]